MKKNNSREFFDDAEDAIATITSAEAMEEADSNPDTSDDEEEWVPKASRRAKYSKMIRNFMNSTETMLTFSNALTTFERCLVHRIAHQWEIEHQSYGEGTERYIVVWKPENRQGKLPLINISLNSVLSFVATTSAPAESAASAATCSYRCLFCGESFNSKQAETDHVMTSCENT